MWRRDIFRGKVYLVVEGGSLTWTTTHSRVGVILAHRCDSEVPLVLMIFWALLMERCATPKAKWHGLNGHWPNMGV